jgi:hypothetical protein
MVVLTILVVGAEVLADQEQMEPILLLVLVVLVYKVLFQELLNIMVEVAELGLITTDPGKQAQAQED